MQINTFVWFLINHFFFKFHVEKQMKSRYLSHLCKSCLSSSHYIIGLLYNKQIIVILYACLSPTLKPLDSVYYSALCFITGDKSLTPHCISLDKVGWPSLTNRRELQCTLLLLLFFLFVLTYAWRRSCNGSCASAWLACLQLISHTGSISLNVLCTFMIVCSRTSCCSDSQF